MVSAGVPNMAMVNVNNFLNVKDSRWLQLEVCREFQRNKCTRPDTECKFAHPPPNVEVQNGRVTACYDSIKGRCNREKPPCKYFHPPQHLKDQLLINGRNHLALKNAIMTQIQGLSPGTAVVPAGSIPVEQIQQQYYPSASSSHNRQDPRPAATQPQYSLYNSAYSSESIPLMLAQHNSPYLAGIPTMSNFNPYIASSPVMTMGVTDGGVGSPLTGVVPQQVVTAQKVPRTDRLEAFPGMGVPYKRPAGDKSGVPVYQPTGSAAYQQALMQQLGGQSFVPVSCEYGGSVPLAGVGGQADNQDTTAANNHAAASSSSAQPIPSTSSLSTSTTTTNSSTTVKAICAPPVTASSSSSSLSLTGTGRDTTSVSPVPLPPQPAANVYSYTGYALSKGLRPQFKPPTTLPHHPSVMGPPSGLANSNFAHLFPPGHLPNINYGVGAPLQNLSVPQYMSSNQHLLPQAMAGNYGLHHGLTSGMMTAGINHSMGSLATAGLGGIGSSGVPMMSPSLVVPQIPSSLYLPQYTALSNNTQYSLAQGGEQPYKKLKTS